MVFNISLLVAGWEFSVTFWSFVVFKNFLLRLIKRSNLARSSTFKPEFFFTKSGLNTNTTILNVKLVWLINDTARPSSFGYEAH